MATSSCWSSGSFVVMFCSHKPGRVMMATWSHKSDQMYFRNDSGIYRWDPTSGISSFAAGVRWENPVFSPDDRYLAYTVWNSAGTTHVVIRDTTNNQTTSSPPLRLSQEFLSNVVLLEQVTQPCGTEGPCGPFARTGSTRTLRIDSGAEGQLPMPAGWGLDAFWQGQALDKLVAQHQVNRKLVQQIVINRRFAYGREQINVRQPVAQRQPFGLAHLRRIVIRRWRQVIARRALIRAVHVRRNRFR